MSNDAKRIYVTRPSLPSLEELRPYLEKIWASRILTNGGPLHEEFEAELARQMQVPAVSLLCNGTIALAVTLNALRVTGEVITTPYSFVATTHVLHWNGIKPVFVDIDRETLNIDPARIESAITPRTTAILGVHVYGNPCNTAAIQQIADLYGLRVIYDAAHAFGVREDGRSVVGHGDASILSFHATKTFNTFEGGAVVCPDMKLKTRVDHLRNFGFADEVTVVAPGINGKMNELQAAIGLLQLGHVAEETRKRARIDAIYRERLGSIPGLRCIGPQPGVTWNHGYFPILVEPEFSVARDALYDHLRSHNVFARRYFYPLISEFPMYRDLPTASPAGLPVAHEISRQVLCLPIYASLLEEDAAFIADLILKESRAPGKSSKASGRARRT
jgi:dTDP-4-amino-4,6-dideoxygalactose transaminase